MTSRQPLNPNIKYECIECDSVFRDYKGRHDVVICSEKGETVISIHVCKDCMDPVIRDAKNGKDPKEVFSGYIFKAIAILQDFRNSMLDA